MTTRRSFLRSALSSAAWLGGGAAAAWLLRDQVFWPAPDAGSIEGAQNSGWLPFAAPQRRIVTVEVGLNGRPVIALIDSGAQYSVIDRAAAQAMELSPGLSPPLVAYGVGGNPQLGQGLRVEVTLGGLKLTALRAASLALGPIAQAVGSPVPLILGQDVLGALTADIDFPGRRLRFHRAEAFTPPSEATAVGARRVGRALHASVELEGAPLELLVDTGSSAAVSLSTDAAKGAGLLDGRPVRSGRSVVLGGVIEGGAVVAESLRFGDQTLRDVDVHLYPPVRAPGFPTGLLGVEALRRRRVLLDLSRGALHLMDSDARS